MRDLAHTRIADGTPMRWFSWRWAQRHRPNLQFLVSTGRHHGAESLEEARLLLVLDFAAGLVDVLSNSLFAASFAQAGFAMNIPSPELFYELLPVHYVQRIDPRCWAKIRGLWYHDADLLGPYLGQRSTRGGKHKGHGVVRRDPRGRRQVFFHDPISHDWLRLPWTGLPPGGQAPAFGDARVRELLKKADTCGLRPQSDADLLPVLLELIGSRIPVARADRQVTPCAGSGVAAAGYGCALQPLVHQVTDFVQGGIAASTRRVCRRPVRVQRHVGAVPRPFGARLFGVGARQ